MRSPAGGDGTFRGRNHARPLSVCFFFAALSAAVLCFDGDRACLFFCFFFPGAKIAFGRLAEH